MRELRDILHHFERTTAPMALATIVGTTGSSYRQAGTRMLVLPSGETVGTLSGGCIEEEVAERSHDILHFRSSTRFTVDTRKRYGCPGSLDILVERIEPGNAFLTYLRRCFEDRQPAQVVVSLQDPIGSFAAATLAFPQAGFRQILLPPIRLVVVGGGADTVALAQMGRILGWEVSIREAVELNDLVADMRTALVVKNHHFARDLIALSFGLSQPFGYVGLLSSRKRKHALLHELDPSDIAQWEEGLTNLHGPAGLDLGGDAPEEIALAIVAEIQAVFAGHSAKFLRDSTEPIHTLRCLVTA